MWLLTLCKPYNDLSSFTLLTNFVRVAIITSTIIKITISLIVIGWKTLAKLL